MSPRLTSNSWAYSSLLPQPPKSLGIEVCDRPVQVIHFLFLPGYSAEVLHIIGPIFIGIIYAGYTNGPGSGTGLKNQS
jgi:hypothetical protein